MCHICAPDIHCEPPMATTDPIDTDMSHVCVIAIHSGPPIFNSYPDNYIQQNTPALNARCIVDCIRSIELADLNEV